MSTQASNAPKPTVATEWEAATHQNTEFVKGLGLTSATTLVMGSMIGSGIFIVSAEIAREVNSPALLIGAWLVTGFMTIVGALSYGELAAMMPRAGPYLRPQMPRPQIQPQLGAMTPFGQPAQPGPRMGIQPVRGPYA